MKELPDISIIIVSWNGKKYLSGLFDSLNNQSYPKEKIEIILVDNGSTDGTLNFVKDNYPEVKLLALGKNTGFAVGNNEGLKQAKNDILVFLNTDIICHKDWLSGLVSGFIRDKSIGSCTSNMILPEAEDFHPEQENLPIDNLYYYDLSIFGYAKYFKKNRESFVFSKIISGCSFIIRKDTINRLGYLFDEDFITYVEDLDLSLRIHNLGLKTSVVKDSAVYHLHEKGVKFSRHFFIIASRAIRNRIFVYFKNMNAMEFLLYFPFIFIGGMFKVFDSRLKFYQKVVFFLPFIIFSVFNMILALFGLEKYAEKRRFILKNRRIGRFGILKLILFGKV
jgi:hypothetical protein